MSYNIEMPTYEKNHTEHPFVMVPQKFIAYDMAILTPSAVVVYLYIALHTRGHFKDQDSIPMSQFRFGVMSNSGEVLDNGTGLSRNTVFAALAELEKYKLIVRQKGYSYGPDRCRIPSYEMVWE